MESKIQITSKYGRRVFVARLLCVLGLCFVDQYSSAATFNLDKSAIPEDHSGDEHFIGHTIVAGEIWYDELGWPMMRVFKPDSDKFPYAKTNYIDIGFSNREQALNLLGIDQAVSKLDFEKSCVVKGAATIEVSDLWSSLGPKARWYTVRLTHVKKKGRFSVIPCVQNG